jgi:hypothetical protein
MKTRHPPFAVEKTIKISVCARTAVFWRCADLSPLCAWPRPRDLCPLIMILSTSTPARLGATSEPVHYCAQANPVRDTSWGRINFLIKHEAASETWVCFDHRVNECSPQSLWANENGALEAAQSILRDSSSQFSVHNANCIPRRAVAAGDLRCVRLYFIRALIRNLSICH